MPAKNPYKKHLSNFFLIALGAFLAALSIRIFLYPNRLIDGGIVGISLIGAQVFGSKFLSPFLVLLNFPFIILAYKFIRKTFVFHMFTAISLFAFFLFLLQNVTPFYGDAIEVIAIGGAVLGAGVGFMIRGGGCTDGTEVLGIIINRKMGFTVGQFILFINIFIFTAYGLIFHDWHIALKSLLTYIVAFKMIDIVMAGLDEVKSVMIITSKPKELCDIILHKLGLGLTVIPGIGGFSKEDRNILFTIVERLDLAELKDIVLREDPTAFMTIENIHEVAYSRHMSIAQKKNKSKKKHFSFS